MEQRQDDSLRVSSFFGETVAETRPKGGGSGGGGPFAGFSVRPGNVTCVAEVRTVEGEYW